MPHATSAKHMVRRLPKSCREKRLVILPVQPVTMVPRLWVIGDLRRPLYDEIRPKRADRYHPLHDEKANSRVLMWYVKGGLRACDIRLTLWHHTVLPATRAHDPTLNVGSWARAAGSTV